MKTTTNSVPSLPQLPVEMDVPDNLAAERQGTILKLFAISWHNTIPIT